MLDRMVAILLGEAVLLTGKAKIVVVQTKVAISFSNFEATCRSHQTDLIVVVLCFLFFHGVHAGMLQGSAPFDLREAIEVLLWWMSLPFCISSNMCQVLLAVGLERSADLRQLLASELEVAHQVQFFFHRFLHVNIVNTLCFQDETPSASGAGRPCWKTVAPNRLCTKSARSVVSPARRSLAFSLPRSRSKDTTASGARCSLAT